MTGLKMNESMNVNIKKGLRADLGLHLQQPLSILSQLRLGLGFTQPHAHQLVLQLTQRVLPLVVFPTACRPRQMTLARAAAGSLQRCDTGVDHSVVGGAYLPVIFQVSDLLPQFLEAS